MLMFLILLQMELIQQKNGGNNINFKLQVIFKGS